MNKQLIIFFLLGTAFRLIHAKVQCYYSATGGEDVDENTKKFSGCTYCLFQKNAAGIFRTCVGETCESHDTNGQKRICCNSDLCNKNEETASGGASSEGGMEDTEGAGETGGAEETGGTEDNSDNSGEGPVKEEEPAPGGEEEVPEEDSYYE